MERAITVTRDFDHNPTDIAVTLTHDIHHLVSSPARDRIHHAGNKISDELEKRLRELGIRAGDQVKLRLNDYTHIGMGLQSVEIGLMREDRVHLLTNETRNPTVGVITPDLLPQGTLSVGRFTPHPGEQETIRALTNDLRMDGQEGLMAPVGRLKRDEVVTIAHPNQVRVLLNLKDPSPEQVEAAVRQNVTRAIGVYFCTYERQAS